jgi:hypothetical protein
MSPFEQPSSEASPFDQLVGEIEISITDSVDSLNAEDAARLYAEILDTQQRLGALRDVLAILETASS